MNHIFLSCALFILMSLAACNRIKTTSSDTAIDKPQKDYAEPPHIDLINARWVLRELNGELVKPKSDIYIRFSDKTNADGFLGCNRFSAQYASEGPEINIGPLRSTKMACEDLSIEGKFAQVLENATSYLTDDKYLYLKNSEGIIIAKLEALYL